MTKHIRYIFDENGTVCGYSTSTNGSSWSHFYFIRNLQGDVLQVFNSSNTIVAEYTYDSWGNILSATGTHASINPFRYRGYYYDAETGWYWLSSRYYDPEVGRFVNADVYISTGQGVLGFNMYAYCLNDPVNRTDEGGYKSFKNDEDNDGIDESTEDITGGGGYFYCVDLSMASRSSIMTGGVHNYGSVHYGYSAPVYGNRGGSSSTVGGTASSTALTTYYPPNNGAVSGTTKYVYLQPGTKIDRYGYPNGNYFAPAGTPLEMRALPPSTDVSIHSSFVVTKPFVVEMGITAPAFGHIGLGVQYYSFMRTNTLLKEKMICYVK